uniref:EOG090X031T n=1 Tax=Daphnia barbata TaxID=414587 RepID=A0A4Y7M2W2_9CRUS|nr:EOG090X031T [Daphnia barbata]
MVKESTFSWIRLDGDYNQNSFHFHYNGSNILMSLFYVNNVYAVIPSPKRTCSTNRVRIPSFSASASPSFATSLTASPSKTSTNPLLRRRCLIATDVDLYSALAPLLPHLQMLWELLLCGEPLVVMATSPSICSHVVQALVNLIHPLQYCLDYRPFFTIHDSEFKEYTGRSSDAPPSVLLGVTNPFFAKALQHWPHIIRIGAEVPSNSGGLKIRATKSNVSGSSKMSECKPGVYTSYKSHLTRDKALLKLIAKGTQTRRPNQVQSALMRRHFLELTQSFIIPLERYFARLMPLQKSISPYKAIPGLSPFKAEEFLASVEHCGPQLTTGVKGDWTGLYRRFLRTPNFESWSQQRHQEANKKLRALQMDALSQSDMTSWLQGKREVEVVDMVLRLREKLDITLAEEALPVSPQTRLHLQGQLDTVLQSLPEDLRSVLKATADSELKHIGSLMILRQVRKQAFDNAFGLGNDGGTLIIDYDGSSHVQSQGGDH